MSFTDDLLEEWETFGRAAGWSEKTVTLRREAAVRLGRYAGCAPEEVTALDLARFLAAANTANTRSTYYRHARSFYAWLKVAGYRDDDPTETVRRPPNRQGIPNPLSDEELERAITAADKRMAAWLTLGAYAGLRAHEIAKVRGEDFDASRRTIRVRGKGDLEAIIPLHPRVNTLSGVMPQSGYWFRGKDPNGPVSPHTVSLLTSRHFKSLGIAGGIHRTRHWFGTNVLRRSGGNLRVAQECLRHSSPATTAIYTKLDDAERSAAVIAL